MIEFDLHTSSKSFFLLLSNGQLVYFSDSGNKSPSTFYFNDQIFNSNLLVAETHKNNINLLSQDNAVIDFVPIIDFYYKNGVLALNLNN